MAGILGRLFREFAVTICTAILISGMVSISLTPDAVQPFPAREQGEKHGILYRAMEGVFDWMLHIYSVTLKWVLHHRPVMLAMFVAVLLVTADLYMVVPKGFIPDTDNDNFGINIEAAQGTSYYQMVKYQQLISSIVVQDPDIESFYSSTGGNFFGPSGASGRMMVNTKPRKQRNVYRRRDGQPAPSQTLQHSRDCASRSRCRRPSAWADACPRAPTITRCTARTPPQLYEEAPKLERALAHMPGLQDVTSDLQIKTPRVNIVLDRDRAAALHLNWQHHLEHAVRRLRPAVLHPPFTPPTTSTACCSKCCRSSSSTPTGWT